MDADDKPLSDDERRDLLKFTGFVVVVVAVVVIVWIVKGTWADKEWVAIGAAAALAQALAVSVALVFAAIQIRVPRQEADRRRRQELLDRVDTFLPELEAAALRAKVSWLTAQFIWERYSNVLPERRRDRPIVEKMFNGQIDEYQTALTSLKGSVNQVKRAFRSLGHASARLVLMDLGALTAACPPPERFAAVEERGEFRRHDFEMLDALLKLVLNEAERITDQYAPADSVIATTTAPRTPPPPPPPPPAQSARCAA